MPDATTTLSLYFESPPGDCRKTPKNLLAYRQQTTRRTEIQGQHQNQETLVDGWLDKTVDAEKPHGSAALRSSSYAGATGYLVLLNADGVQEHRTQFLDRRRSKRNGKSKLLSVSRAKSVEINTGLTFFTQEFQHGRFNIPLILRIKTGVITCLYHLNRRDLDCLYLETLLIPTIRTYQ